MPAPKSPASGASRRTVLGALLALGASAAQAAQTEAVAPPDYVPLGPTPPEILPGDFEVPALAGGDLRLSQVAGPALLVHFFATWCVYCRSTMRQLQVLKRDLGTDIGIVALSVGEPAVRVERYLHGFDPGFAIGVDRAQQVSRGWRVWQIPTHVVLDRALRPRLYAQGIVDWQSAETRAALKSLATSG